MFSKTLWFCLVILSASMTRAEMPISPESGDTAPRFQIALKFIAVPDQKSWLKLGLQPTQRSQSEVDSPEELDHEPLGEGESAIRLVSATQVTQSRSPFQCQVVTREQLRQSIPGLENCICILSTQFIVASGKTGTKFYPTAHTDFEFDLAGEAGVEPLEVANLLDDDIHILARPDLCDDGSVDLAFQWELSRTIKTDEPQRKVSRVKLNTNLKAGETLAVWCDSQSAANLLGGMKRFPIRRSQPIPLVLLLTPRGPLSPEAERIFNPPPITTAKR